MSEQPDGPTWALYASFAADRSRPLGAADREGAAAAAEEALAVPGVSLRGAYSVSGYRADADMLLWLVGDSADGVQDALIAFRACALGRSLLPAWSAIGVHREAEFAKSHTPAFMRGEAPCRYVSVYPYVRSLEWYLLPADERSAMLREHGEMGRSAPEVRANTVSAFALGDYEWLLAFECDELEPIVDLMRLLRSAQARRHTREEIPFHTGRRRPL
ncbi:MAG TPA: hydrogen peroxide-dependent heme synthase, partial [Solirubrobacteraceae bacterium]|nr:hydrogen peroxide-dependent heme synthase [Solirubrobacteraceae bacterium]